MAKSNQPEDPRPDATPDHDDLGHTLKRDARGILEWHDENGNPLEEFEEG